MTDLERINNLKHVLIDYAERHDAINGGYHAIQSVQKMAGYSNEKDYILALLDGLKYGNWPWTSYGLGSERKTKQEIDKEVNYLNKELNKGCEK